MASLLETIKKMLNFVMLFLIGFPPQGSIFKKKKIDFVKK